jgi:hypothetical protein
VIVKGQRLALLNNNTIYPVLLVPPLVHKEDPMQVQVQMTSPSVKKHHMKTVICNKCGHCWLGDADTSSIPQVSQGYTEQGPFINHQSHVCCCCPKFWVHHMRNTDSLRLHIAGKCYLKNIASLCNKEVMNGNQGHLVQPAAYPIPQATQQHGIPHSRTSSTGSVAALLPCLLLQPVASSVGTNTKLQGRLVCQKPVVPQ